MKGLWAEVRPYLTLWVVVLVMVGVALHRTEVRDRARAVEACKRGNVQRSTDLGNIRIDQVSAGAMAGQEHDPEIANIWQDRATAKKTLGDSLVTAAELTGHQTGPGEATLVCDDVVTDVPLMPW